MGWAIASSYGQSALFIIQALTLAARLRRAPAVIALAPPGNLCCPVAHLDPSIDDKEQVSMLSPVNNFKRIMMCRCTAR